MLGRRAVLTAWQLAAQQRLQLADTLASKAACLSFTTLPRATDQHLQERSQSNFLTPAQRRLFTPCLHQCSSRGIAGAGRSYSDSRHNPFDGAAATQSDPAGTSGSSSLRTDQRDDVHPGEDTEQLSDSNLEAQGSEVAESSAETSALASPPAQEEAEDSLLYEIENASRKRQMFLLNQLLRNNSLADQPRFVEEEETLNPFADMQREDTFRLKVVDINRTSKGTKAGRIASITATVIVGNGMGVLGFGTGKSLEVAPALRKAVERAQKDVVAVPMTRVHGIHTAKYGKVKVTLYPRSIGAGLHANELVMQMLQLAGLRDIGIKVHGSRNKRNTIMAVFEVLGKINLQQAGALQTR